MWTLTAMFILALVTSMIALWYAVLKRIWLMRKAKKLNKSGR